MLSARLIAILANTNQTVEQSGWFFIHRRLEQKVKSGKNRL